MLQYLRLETTMRTCVDVACGISIAYKAGRLAVGLHDRLKT